MSIIGHGSTARIAVACGDGTVGIYDSVTGVLRLSLNPPNSIQAMAGSPDGSAFFCTRRESPSVTMWDIQTGGLIHTFVLKGEAKATVVSLKGRYLAYSLFDGTLNVWEVANKLEVPAFRQRFADHLPLLAGTRRTPLSVAPSIPMSTVSWPLRPAQESRAP